LKCLALEESLLTRDSVIAVTSNCLSSSLRDALGQCESADYGAAQSAPKSTQTPAPTPQVDQSGGLLVQTRETLVSALTIVILTLFLLAAGPPVLARMTAAFAKDTRASQILKVIEAIRGEVKWAATTPHWR
jgi:hypothetical protein